MRVIKSSFLSLSPRPILVGIFTLIGLAGCTQSVSSVPKSQDPTVRQAKTKKINDSETRTISFESRAFLTPVAAAKLATIEIPTSEITERFEDGTTRRTFTVSSANPSIWHGRYVERYPNGQIFCQGTFSHGRRDGSWTYYYENGQMARNATYQTGQPSGRWKWYRPDGTLARLVEYHHGLQHGIAAEFAPDGRTAVRETHYSYDEKDGVETLWNDQGVKIHEITFENGMREGPVIWWHDNGQKSMVGRYHLDKPDGAFIYWDRLGVKFRQVNWRDGSRSLSDIR
jgi:antitoxin component YwqK of YwqJK toxin-antitoxin module